MGFFGKIKRFFRKEEAHPAIAEYKLKRAREIKNQLAQLQCGNEKCKRMSRDRSRYCQKCADKHNEQRNRTKNA